MQTPDRVLKGEYDTGNADDRYIKNVDALSAGETSQLLQQEIVTYTHGAIIHMVS